MEDRLARFEWDEKKAALNFKKHGVRFEDAALTFFDPNFIRLFDAKHSTEEIRYAGIGAHPGIGNSESNRPVLLVTIYTERGDKFRIISARKGNKKERQDYEDAAT